MEFLENDIKQFCEMFCSQIAKAESPYQLEQLESFNKEQTDYFLQNITCHKDRYEIDLEEINREAAREKLSAKNYSKSGPNRHKSRQLVYYEQSLKKLQKERDNILEELENLKQLERQLEAVQKDVGSKLVSLKGEEYLADELLAKERCGLCFNDVEVGNDKLYEDNKLINIINKIITHYIIEILLRVY